MGSFRYYCSLALFCTVILGLLAAGYFLYPDGEGAGGVKTLTLLTTAQERKDWRPHLDEFSRRRPDIRIRLVEAPSSTDAKEDMYITAFLSGQRIYDLVFADIIWIPKFASMGWLAPLDSFFSPEEKAEFFPALLEACTFRGQLYRVPLSFSCGVLYYRTDILDSLKLPPPRTFDDLVRAAQAARSRNIYGFTFQGKQYEGLVCNFLEVLAGYGGFWIDPHTGEVGLDRPAARAALDFYRNCLSPWNICPPGVVTYEEESSRQVFNNGAALFHRNWPYVWITTTRIESPVHGRVGMAPMVNDGRHPSAATLGGWGFAISRRCPYPEAAAEFIRFMTSVPVVKQLYLQSGNLPPRMSLYQDPEMLKLHPELTQLYAVAQTIRPRPAITRYSQASAILQRYLSAALTGQMDPGAAMREAAERTRVLLRK
jgi:multiple sugar transport system substrate-binding protein